MYKIEIDSFGEYEVRWKPDCMDGYLLWANGFKTFNEAEKHIEKLKIMSLSIED